MIRIENPPVRSELSPEQQECHDWHVSYRGSVRGPFVVLIHDPEIAELFWPLGSKLFSIPGLSAAEAQLATLTVARERGVRYMWSAHEPLAADSGVVKEALEVVRSKGETTSLSPRDKLIIDFTRAIVRTSSVEDELFIQATQEFGRAAVVRMTALVGAMLMSGSLLTTFEVQPESDPGWQ